MSSEPGSTPVDLAVQFIEAAAAAVDACDREDLARHLRRVRDHTLRPSVLVGVVGEYKQGKSSLINAALGQSLCPVDDDLATSVITVIYHRDEPQLAVHRRENGEVVVENRPIDELEELASERGNPDNTRGIERIDVGIPHPVLAHGLALVDTVGAGGLSPAAATATLAFLRHADAVLFVSDASAELDRPEAEFLHRATDACSPAYYCLTKTDLYPDWRRIAELDAAHLRDIGVSAAIVPLSSTVRQAALASSDSELDAASGFPHLLEVLERDVVERVRREAAREALTAGVGAMAQLRNAYQTELDLLAGDGDVETALVPFEEAKSRLEHLQGPGARWATVLNDRVADLSNDAAHQFRGALRLVNREIDAEVEKLKSGRDWEAVTAQLQLRVAEAVTNVFERLAARIESARDEILQVLQEEKLELPGLTRTRATTDLGALWSDRPIEQRSGTKAGRVVGQGWVAVRSGAGALITFGMLARFLPAAGAALLFSAPVTLGLGAAFGGAQLLQQRRQRIASRRQQARAAVRQYLDEVQFEVSNELTDTLRSAQRELRDGFGDRVAELHRTYSDSIRRAHENAKSGVESHGVQRGELQQRVARFDELLETADRLGPQL